MDSSSLSTSSPLQMRHMPRLLVLRVFLAPESELRSRAPSVPQKSQPERRSAACFRREKWVRMEREADNRDTSEEASLGLDPRLKIEEIK